MSKDNWDIQFIKPCRLPDDEHLQLTAQYSINAMARGRLVQINLDNCSIQRMEDLSQSATLDDVEAVGLLPLYHLLHHGRVALSAIGIHEMPDRKVEGARRAYYRFCKKFWPGHVDDHEATSRAFDPHATAAKVRFSDLEDGSRTVYGSAYVAMLQIQNIKLSYPGLAPEEQFRIYLHSMIHLLNIVSAFELEIAKYAFWALSKSQINNLEPAIKQRRKDIRENFAKVGTDLDKCRNIAFDAALDLHWLSGANLAQDAGADIEIGGKRFLLDNWVGTNDHKLYRINRDIHSTFFGGSTMKMLVTAREEALERLPYWQAVDSFARETLRYRAAHGHPGVTDLLMRIDSAVQHLEQEIHKARTVSPA